MGLSFVIFFQVFTQIIHLISYHIWGRFSEKHTTKAILSISMPLFAIALFLWTFTTLPDTHFLTIPLLFVIHTLMGISLSGINLGASTIGLKLAPQEKATSYIASASLVNSIAAGIAPIIGGLFADFFSSRSLSFQVAWKDPVNNLVVNTFHLQHWDFFFILALIFVLYSMHLLTKVEEHGTATRKERNEQFMAEIRREMVNLSTLAGIRAMTKFPVLLARKMKGKKDQPKS